MRCRWGFEFWYKWGGVYQKWIWWGARYDPNALERVRAAHPIRAVPLKIRRPMGRERMKMIHKRGMKRRLS